MTGAHRFASPWLDWTAAGSSPGSDSFISLHEYTVVVYRKKLDERLVRIRVPRAVALCILHSQVERAGRDDGLDGTACRAQELVTVMKGIEMTTVTISGRDSSGQPADGAAPTAQDLSGIVGHHIVYTYANDWKYEMYIKNASTIDYHVHTGDVRGRVVKGQPVDLVQLDDGHYKLSWTEPTGTSVAVNYLPGKRRVHGSTFFPQWVAADGSKIAVYQNDHLDEMRRLRAAGPTYPIEVITEFATIASFTFVGVDDESVIPAPTRAPND